MPESQMFQLAGQCSLETELSEEPPLKGQVTKGGKRHSKVGRSPPLGLATQGSAGMHCGDLGCC